MSKINRPHPSDEPFRYPDHPRPRTRREFLSQGFLSGLGMVALPSMASLIAAQQAKAQLAGCTLAASGGMVPFICIDLAGGANMVGSNALAGGPAGALASPLSVAGYSKQGLPADQIPTLAGQVDSQFGLPFHVDSAFLRGMLDKTTQATRDMVDGAVICARSNNDTANNPLNPLYGIAKAGASGDVVGLVGTENSESGGNSLAPMDMIDPADRPTKIDRPSDARGLVDTGRLVQLLNQNDAGEVMSAVEQISALKLDNVNEDDLIKDLVLCGYVKTTDQVSRFGNPDQLDPLLDPMITGATGIFDAGELNNSKFRKTASVMKLVCNSLAGAGCIEMGGYDYHDGTRATGEVRDFEAGQCMGAILEYSRLVGTPVMLYVFSDGSLDSDGQIDNSNDGRGKGSWRGDNSSTGAAIMLVMDPTTPGVRAPMRRQQVGHFQPSGDVDRQSSIVADDPNLLTQAVVLNYLALHGREGDLDSVLPMHGLGGSATRDPVIALDRMAAV